MFVGLFCVSDADGKFTADLIGETAWLCARSSVVVHDDIGAPLALGGNGNAAFRFDG